MKKIKIYHRIDVWEKNFIKKFGNRIMNFDIPNENDHICLFIDIPSGCEQRNKT